MGGKASFTPAFDDFRFYADGTESGSSPLANQGTNVTINVGAGNQQAHLRVRIQETGGADGASTDDYGLEYQVNAAGGWTPVTAASARVQSDTGSSLTDGSATTNRGTNGITDGTGSFVAGEQEEANGVIEDHTLTASNFTEHVWALLVLNSGNSNADTLGFRITLNGGNPGMTNSVTPVITISKPHDLLANDVQSTSEVSSPAIGQTHALLATSVQSTSEVSAPTVVEVTILLADDIESASEVTTPSVGQIHALTVASVQSTSEVSAPVLGQEHSLLADDVQSTSEVSTPNATESNILLADDVQSTSEVSTPNVGQEHALLADDVQSTSEVVSPAVGQVHVLTVTSVQSTSEVSAPVLAEVGSVDNLLADDIESSSEVTAPTLAQVHVLLVTSVQSLSELTAPVLGGPGGSTRRDTYRSLMVA